MKVRPPVRFEFYSTFLRMQGRVVEVGCGSLRVLWSDGLTGTILHGDTVLHEIRRALAARTTA